MNEFGIFTIPAYRDLLLVLTPLMSKTWLIQFHDTQLNDYQTRS